VSGCREHWTSLSNRKLKSALSALHDHNARPSQTDGQTDGRTDRQTDEDHGNSPTIRSMNASRAKMDGSTDVID